VVDEVIRAVVLLDVLDDLRAGVFAAPSTTWTSTPPGTLYWMQIASPLLLPTGKKSTSNIAILPFLVR